MEMRVETLDSMTSKRFFLQYRFPPSSVGEVGRVGGINRREVGHGNLAERALEACLPSAATFPYSIRAESLITESCGSSSMATGAFMNYLCAMFVRGPCLTNSSFPLAPLSVWMLSCPTRRRRAPLNNSCWYSHGTHSSRPRG